MSGGVPQSSERVTERLAKDAPAPEVATVRACLVGTGAFLGFCAAYIATALYRVPRPVYDVAARRWHFVAGGFGAIITWYGQILYAAAGAALVAGVLELLLRRRIAARRAVSRETLILLCGWILTALLLDLVYCFCLVWSLR